MLILKLLESRDMYGYQIIEELNRRSNNIFELKAGTLYPLLHSLRQKELLTSYEKTVDKGPGSASTTAMLAASKISWFIQYENGRIMINLNKELAEEFQVSIDTIRRDLTTMEENSLLKKLTVG
jgi:Fe2+ or Zn2+ uptake regulation protein